MVKSYQWLIDMLSEIFGKDHIVYQELNYGLEFGITYVNGNKRSAFMVEKTKNYVPTAFANVEQEDGSISYEPVSWKYEIYSLNKDKNKDLIVADLIKKWKGL